ncbi:Hypothetical protein POVR1_LOCUS340 [uncultured virus]|nr:Hypothetical protein POVR1_LOCUS340 [uncultured virus]
MYLLIAALLLVGVMADSDKDEQYDRTILQFTTATVPAGIPLPVTDLSTIVDPNFAREKAILNYYTNSQLDDLKARAFDGMLKVWGYNFSQAGLNPAFGAYFLPGIGLFPYTRIGRREFPITRDSKYPKRNNFWILHQVGWIGVKNVFLPVDPCTIATGVGNYSSLKNLSIAYPGDLIQFGDLNFVHPDLGVNKTYTDPNNTNHREVIRVRSLWTSRQTSNGEGAADTLGKLQAAQIGPDGQYPAFDEISDNNGYEMSGVHRAVQLDGATTFYGRAAWTWPGRSQDSSKRSLSNWEYLFSNPLPR